MTQVARLYLSQPRIEGPIYLSADDLLFLQNRISAAEHQIMVLEKHVRETLTRELKKQAKKIEILLLKNILSPIRRVPVEILSLIFELACSSLHFPDNDLMRSTCVVSSVCVAWRNTAQATPRIWSKICLSRTKHPKAFTGSVDWIRGWLTRSRGHPLLVSLDVQRVDPLDEVPSFRFTQLVQHIVGFCHQTRWILFSGDAQVFLPLFRLPSASFPLLEGIYMNILPAQVLTHLFPNKVQTFLAAPKLRHLEVAESVDESLLKSLALPENELTNLVIRGQRLLSSRSLDLDILYRCKSLVNLTIHFHYGQKFQFAGFDESNRFVLPALRMLDITCHPVTGARRGVNLLRSLVAPHLEFLILRWRGQPYDQIAVDIGIFQSRSMAQVETFDFKNFSGTTVDQSGYLTGCLLAMLRTLPTIKVFKFGYGVYDADFLLREMTYYNKEPVLPNLKRFELAHAYPRGWDSSRETPTLHLTSMVLSRTVRTMLDERAPAILERVFLYGPQFKEDAERILLIAPGMYLRHYDSYQDHNQV
ncbi:hypothetical protein D9757_003563 [Collybiopsis confluens]|uniref:F-box domain-containing protein n=1 Tax=Collybiopsis confluens TaxID=2823264 RepID=A0A8H5MD17_9AGAR|nr:hypothetical protein D9757_003563 [Collybiopsis confluens]